jgi:hypothetical protein
MERCLSSGVFSAFYLANAKIASFSSF